MTRVRDGPTPQAFDGITVILPEPLPAIKVIELDKLLPDQPEGADQEYVVPGIFVTL